MDDRRRAPVALVRLIGWTVSLLTIVFVVRILLRADLHWRDVADIRWGMVAVAVVLFQVWYYVRGWIWLRLLRQVGTVDQRLPSLRRWVASELLRYIPGNVWSFVGRYQGAKQVGSETKPAIGTIVTEAWILLVGAAVTSSVTLRDEWYGGWLIVGTVVVVFLPMVVKKYVTVRRPELFGLALLSTVNWLIYGVAYAVLFRAIPSMPTVSWPMLIGTNVAAWLFGYLSLITPMGLGVREAVLIRLLGDFGVTSGVAALAASIGRVLLIVGEGIFFALIVIAELVARPKRLEVQPKS